MEQFKKKFLEEATELIANLEQALLSLDENPQDKSLHEEVFRIMHSLKGGSSMFGFDKIDAFTHELESIYDLVRNQKIELKRNILDITLESVDHIKILLESGDELSAENEKNHSNLLNKIYKITKSVSGDIITEKEEIEKHDDKNDNVIHNQLSDKPTYQISINPDENIFKNGTNPLYLIDELASLGHCKVFAKTNKIPEFDELKPELCYVSWEVFLSTDKSIDDINDVFIFVDDICEIEINKIDNSNLLEITAFTNEISNVVPDDGFSELDKIKELANNVKANEVKEEEAIKDQSSQDFYSQIKKNVISNIRVASDKLDDLMNLVSELITTQASLTLYAENNQNSELVTIAENIEKISRQLRDNTFEICLIPIDTMMVRFKRLVRDLSFELDKEIQFTAEGTETELDKTIIEGLTEPIMHIFRNSIDHGIESADERIKKGKPKQGTINFKAFHSGTNVYIQIKDNGRGLDAEKIREKAISRGFISPEANLSYQELINLVFLPGFSTASKVTEVSGRGVGLDVVVKKISDIRGEVEIESQLGVGTTITIKLPLTMSIIDGLLVEIDKTSFVIPLSSVDKCFEVKTETLNNNFNNRVKLDGSLIPYINLRKEFDINENCPDVQQVIRINYDNFNVGLSVDKVIGEYQAVLKPLGRLFKDLEIVSGATILGDGSIALVLDSGKIINTFDRETLERREAYYKGIKNIEDN